MIKYYEINQGYRKWVKKTLYLKNGIPSFISENTSGMITLYTNQGEKFEPCQHIDEIYVYNWNNEKIRHVLSGYEGILLLKICKICYLELIEKIKLKFIAKKR